MTSFQTQKTITPSSTALDLSKHTNYTRGMILGEDDLLQEFAYLNGRDKLAVRELIGYGTVCGLRVHIEQDTKGNYIAIEPGLAVNPQGQFIRVTDSQCAYLQNWLAAPGRRQELFERFGGAAPGALMVLPLYVSLCYAECETDKLPLPGEPCRSEDEVMVASRIMDSYQLHLKFAPPPAQPEEDAVREFVAWLRTVEISSDPDTLSLEMFEAQIRERFTPLSPLSPLSPLLPLSPLSPPGNLKIPAAQSVEYLRAAFLMWTTELRSLSGCGDIPAEECMLLAKVNVSLVWDALTNVWVLASPIVATLDETQRPYVLHLRMLQEWALGNLTVSGVAGPLSPPASPGITLSGDVDGPLENNIVSAIQNIPVVPTLAAPPGDGQLLAFQTTPSGGHWIAVDPSAAPVSPITDVVRHTAKTYSIVAAGVVTCDGTSGNPNYNKLTAKAGRGGTVAVTFADYTQPDASFMYIVKVLPVSPNEDGALPLNVNLGAFQARGFTLVLKRLGISVAGGNPELIAGPLNDDELKQVELMIEVSRYEA